MHPNLKIYNEKFKVRKGREENKRDKNVATGNNLVVASWKGYLEFPAKSDGKEISDH